MIALNLTNLRDKLSMRFICWVFYAKLDEKARHIQLQIL